jgi:hypothetical protein
MKKILRRGQMRRENTSSQISLYARNISECKKAPSKNTPLLSIEKNSKANIFLFEVNEITREINNAIANKKIVMFKSKFELPQKSVSILFL